MEKPIVNPEVPYTGVLSDGLQQGKMCRIQGVVPSSADRFSVNFQTGPNLTPRDNTALHLSVRLKQGYIARNSFLNRAWGEEDGRGGLPIGPGQQFEIIVMADAKDFKIAVNGQHYCEFPYRIPKDKITHLIVEGDVVITLISWEGVLPAAPPPEGGDVARSATAVEGGTTPTAAPPAAQGFAGGAPAQGFGGPPSSQGQGFGGPPPSQGFGGPPPPQGFGPPSQQGYGPPPQQGYGPPPQQGYGPPPQGFGPPNQGFGGPQGYGPPLPPGSESQSGFDHFLQSAQSVLADAISSGAAEKLLGNILHPNQNQGFSPQQAQYGQYPHPTQQQQQQQQRGQGDFNVPQFGGEGSVGGFGSVGSFFSNLAGQVLNPKPSQGPQGPQGGYGGQYNQRNQY